MAEYREQVSVEYLWQEASTTAARVTDPHQMPSNEAPNGWHPVSKLEELLLPYAIDPAAELVLSVEAEWMPYAAPAPGVRAWRRLLCRVVSEPEVH